MNSTQPTRFANPSPRRVHPRDGNGQLGQLGQSTSRLTFHIAALIAAVLLAMSPAAAQQAKEPTVHDRAIAAGYKAAMLCSGIFDAQAMGAKRTRESIEANELKGIYPEYDGLIAAMPAVIERGQMANRVLVTYDPDAPPRIAYSQLAGGCRNLPIGTPTSFVNDSEMYMSETEQDDAFSVAARKPPGLSKLVDRAFDGSYGAGSNTTGILIVTNRQIAAERYARGFGANVPTRTWSVAKSISGTIIGAAVAKGWIDPKAPAPIPEWQKPGDPRAAITLDNLMRMASGLHSDTAGNRTDAVYFGGTAVTEETVNWPLEAEPGTRFRYANNDILLAIHALAGKAAEEDYTFPLGLLLHPLGMDHTIPERDWKDNYILSSQVWSTARDLARLGQFWLQDGVWQGERILPEGWMKYMTTPSGPQPASGPGYGATMWLFGPAQGLPEGSYAAQGNRGQFVMVIPSKKLVIVRRGEDPGQARFDIAKFTADVIAALP